KEHAGHVVPIAASHLEGILRAHAFLVFFHRVRWRKHLVAWSARWFEHGSTANRDYITLQQLPELLQRDFLAHTTSIGFVTMQPSSASWCVSTPISIRSSPPQTRRRSKATNADSARRDSLMSISDKPIDLAHRFRRAVM